MLDEIMNVDMEYFEMGMNPAELEQGNHKPEQSFTQMIKQAISSSARQRLFLAEIYKWILETYPYFKNTNDQGWRNSVRHSLSTTKEFVRIKETRHRYSRGSEWCLADSSLGRWYLELTEECHEEDDSSSPFKSKEQEFSRLFQLSTLIPELSTSMVPRSPEKPVLINLATCPDYLLGQVPHPELFIFKDYKKSRTPSPGSGEIGIKLPDMVSDALLGSPLSRKATPKSFDAVEALELDIGNEFLDFN